MPGAPRSTPEYLQHTATHLWHQIFPVAITTSCFGEKEGLCECAQKKKTSWFSLIMRPVKQCSVHFWLNFIFPYLPSILHYSEHMQLETTQTMNVRVRCHFSQHLLSGRKSLLQKQCKMEQFCTAWHYITTCCQEQCKSFMKKLMIWMKIQGKADISRAVLHFKTARNAKTVKISVALQC